MCLCYWHFFVTVISVSVSSLLHSFLRFCNVCASLISSFLSFLYFCNFFSPSFFLVFLFLLHFCVRHFFIFCQFFASVLSLFAVTSLYLTFLSFCLWLYLTKTLYQQLILIFHEQEIYHFNCYITIVSDVPHLDNHASAISFESSSFKGLYKFMARLYVC